MDISLAPESPAPCWQGPGDWAERDGEEEGLEAEAGRGLKAGSWNRPPHSHTLSPRPSKSDRVQLLPLGWDVTSNTGMTAMMLFNIN